MDTISREFYDSSVPGPHLVIFGAIHGNEPCGPRAIQKVIESIRNGSIKLIKGRVTFVPIANPEAYALHQRFVEENLNRIFKKNREANTYEGKLANDLADVITSGDIFLDIHSTSAPGPTSVFIDYPTPENESWAEYLGMEFALLGWPILYENNPKEQDSFDTTRFAHENQKTGLIIECGQHDALEAVTIAERSILRTLSHFNMIDAATPIGHDVTKRIRMTALIYKDNEKDVLLNEWSHLEPLAVGTLIARRITGEEIVADEDARILLPKHAAKAGEEWFYLGVSE